MAIRLAKPEDAAKLSTYFCDNEHHFRIWEPIRERGYYSEISLKERLTEYEKPCLATERDSTAFG